MAKNAVVTGGNGGIGLEMARGLAQQGYRVIIASRDGVKNAAAVADIKAGLPQAEVESLPLDLADYASIDAFAAQVLQRMPVIDALILNAGLYTMQLRRLASGFEAMMGVMHFGHFRLTQRLLEAVKAAPSARIVVTSSGMHDFGRLDEATFRDPSKHWWAPLAYGQAKLANILFTRELARRLAGTRVTVNAFHPGGVATGIYRETPGVVRHLLVKVMLTPKQGADTGLWLATAPELAGVSGEYFIKRRKKSGSGASRDMQRAAWLWRYSEAQM